MAVVKEITIEVNDSDVKELTRDLNQLDNSINDVENSADQASASLKDVGDNGGAIAILDELTGGLATKIRDAAEASKLFNTSLKGTRTALIATGIGAFVVALGLVVAYWDEIVDLITGANEQLQRQIDLQNELIDDLSFELELLEAKEKLLIAEGKSTEEITQQKARVIELLLEENALLIEKLRLQFENEQAQVREVTLWENIRIAALQAVGAYERANQAIADSLLGDEDERTRLAEIEQQLRDAQLRAEQLRLSLFQVNNPDGTDQGRENASVIGGPLTAEQQAEALARQQQQFEERFNLTELQNKTLMESTMSVNAEILADDSITQAKLREASRITAEIIKRQQEEELLLARNVANAKVNIALNTLQLLTQIAGQDSKIGKGFAVAQATISGIQGIQNAYTTAQKSPITAVFPAYPLIQAGLAGAFSALQIKNILSTDETGQSTPGLGVSQGAAASTPSFNIVGTSDVNQLAQSLNEQETAPVQAFVVGSNVTSQQELDNNITTTATLG